MFMRLQTQWNFAGMGTPCGISLPAIESLFRVLRVKNRADMLDDLQVMEAAALRVFDERAKESK